MPAANLHPIFAQALAPFAPPPAPMPTITLSEALRTVDACGGSFTAEQEADGFADGYRAALDDAERSFRRQFGRLAARDPEPDDFEPQDGHDYDDPHDLLS